MTSKIRKTLGVWIPAITLFHSLTFGVAEAKAASARNSISLSGADWQIHDDPLSQGVEQQYFNADLTGAGWIAAQVPGNIQADLEAAHLLAPLWYGAVNTNLYEVARKDWWYRKDFMIPASYAGQRITLDCDGVDEHCKVWLNGKLIGENGGMFRRFWFDVSEVALPGATNRLAVQLNRMPEALMPFLVDSDDPDIGGGPSSPHWFVYGINETRKLLKDLKTPGVWSYDWSANVWALGIWKDMRLEASGPVRIDWTRVETTLDDDFNQEVVPPTPESAGVVTVSRGTNSFSRATVHALLELDSLSNGLVRASFRIRGANADVVIRTNVTLVKGSNVLKAELIVDKPALWWPNGQGAQPLYTLDAELKPVGARAASDKSSTRFGIRQLRWVHTDSQPSDIYVRSNHYTLAEYAASKYQLLVNGRPVRGIGTAITFPYALPGCGSEHELRLLQLAKHAGMNLIRLNGGGGGPLLDEAWYNLADELGIMIAYEYPAGNSIMEDDSVFLANLEATCRNMLKQSRNHPSIIQYLGGNEMGWARSQEIPALQLMQKIAAQESDRLFRGTDPEPDNKHGPYWFDILQSKETFGYGNGHYPFNEFKSRDGYAYYSGEDSETMWYGEFGTSSPANLEVWHREIPLKSQWPLDDVMNDAPLIYHNAIKAVGGDSWLFKSRIEAAFGPLDNLHDLIAAGQYYGAEGLRYIYDGLRRKGKRIGGMTNHDYSEPWPNAAGSYMVDYDGRTLMNYDFLRLALAPVSLSLQVESCLYTPESGIQAELFLVSDAPKEAAGLRAKWLARDRTGFVFARGEKTGSIAPLEVKSLGKITLHPPQKTIGGPVLVELKLEDSAGKLLVERVQVFGHAGIPAPFAGLIKNGNAALVKADSSALDALPNGANNLAFVGNGAKPATASSALPDPKHQPQGLNDGNYGNDYSWIGLAPGSAFQIDLGKPATIGQFKLGRDRTGKLADRLVDYLKIETSPDGQTWQTVFEQSGLTELKDFSFRKSMLISIAPVQAQWVKATAGCKKTVSEETPCVDEFEVFAPSKETLARLPQVRFTAPVLKAPGSKVCPVSRTTLEVSATPMGKKAGQEVYALKVKNTGSMTALFCEPHPRLVYRTDLFIDNNNCFIPPGESRVITIRASSRAKCGLSLAQTGWTISTWNADDVTVASSADVLLSVGRWDKICREFAGYFDVNQVSNCSGAVCTGNRADAGKLPYRLSGTGMAQFEFDCSGAQARHPARLRIHTSDQSEVAPTVVQITFNGRRLQQTLPKGLGIQRTDPAHRAYPATVEFDLAGSELRKKSNTLTVSIAGDGWFAWDALELVSKPQN